MFCALTLRDAQGKEVGHRTFEAGDLPQAVAKALEGATGWPPNATDFEVEEIVPIKGPNINDKIAAG